MLANHNTFVKRAKTKIRVLPNCSRDRKTDCPDRAKCAQERSVSPSNMATYDTNSHRWAKL